MSRFNDKKNKEGKNNGYKNTGMENRRQNRACGKDVLYLRTCVIYYVMLLFYCYVSSDLKTGDF